MKLALLTVAMAAVGFAHLPPEIENNDYIETGSVSEPFRNLYTLGNGTYGVGLSFSPGIATPLLFTTTPAPPSYIAHQLRIFRELAISSYRHVVYRLRAQKS